MSIITEHIPQCDFCKETCPDMGQGGPPVTVHRMRERMKANGWRCIGRHKLDCCPSCYAAGRYREWQA